MDRKIMELGARLADPALYAWERLGLKLHPKQAAVLRDLFRKPGSRLSFLCSNEVGKTTHVVAVAILYAIEMLGAQAISTAGVWMQVEQQLIPALKRFSALFPFWDFQDTGIKVNGIDRYVGFSTRNEGFAQGFHRRAGMPLFGAVDEAAAVDGAIISGVEDRCNPDYFLLTGSPLDPAGAFYDAETKFAALYTHHSLSQPECLTTDGYWIEPASIERKRLKYGEEHPFFKSNVLGQFSDLVEGALISLSEFNKALDPSNYPPWEVIPGNERHGFMDFAGGRAKNVFAVRHGNRVWIAKKWTDRNTMSACGEFLATYRKLHNDIGLLPEEIDGDADGMGLPMIQRLAEMGLKVGHFHGGNKPRFSEEYVNEVSEAWGEGAGKMKRMNIIMPNDTEFKAQVLTRKLKRASDGKFQLESKEDMAKRGVESPDEADSIFGAAMPSKLMVARPVFGRQPEPLAPTKAQPWPGRIGDDWQQERQELPEHLPGAWGG